MFMNVIFTQMRPIHYALTCFRVIKLKLWRMMQLPFISLVAVNGAYSLCNWVFSEASLLQQILRHQTLTIHRSLARYTCRPTQSTATSSLLNFTHARPYSHQNFSRLENTADLSSPLTAWQRKLAQQLLLLLFLLPWHEWWSKCLASADSQLPMPITRVYWR